MARTEKGINVGPLERVISLALGAAGGAFVLRRRSPASVLMAGISGYLLERGLTGRCRAYRALGITGSEVGRTVSACSQVTIQLPVSHAYAFVSDLSHLPRFSRFITGAESLGNGLWRLRARGALAPDREWLVRKTVDESNRRVAWCALEGEALPSAAEVRLNAGPAGTEVHVDLWFVGDGPEVFTSALRRAEGSRPLRRAGLTPSQVLEQELRRLRQVVETGATVTSARVPREAERPPGSSPTQVDSTGTPAQRGDRWSHSNVRQGVRSERR